MAKLHHGNEQLMQMNLCNSGVTNDSITQQPDPLQETARFTFMTNSGMRAL